MYLSGQIELKIMIDGALFKEIRFNAYDLEKYEKPTYIK